MQLLSVADYRIKVFQGLYAKLGDKFKIYTGEDSFQEGIKLADLKEPYFVPVENVYYAGKKLCVQRGVVGPAMAAESTNLKLNPRILTNWLIASRRRRQGKPLVMWGHAWPRGGPNSKSDKVRHKMRSYADLIVVYTESQATELAPKMPGTRVIAAPNALYSRGEMASGIGVQRTPSDFIYVGRFVKSKKPDFLIRSFAKAVGQLPANCRLIMVGDGPTKPDLVQLVEELGVASRVEFPGWISEFEALRPFYQRSIASVSPGYMGLSGTQSFAMGVPMIISKTENHAPEIEAVRDGFNGIYFETDSEDALANDLLAAATQADKWTHRSDSIIEDCMARYSTDLMVERLAEAFAYRKVRH